MRSPVAVGVVLGLVVGGGAAAAIAATSSNETPAKPPRVAVQHSTTVNPGEAQGYRLGSDPAPGSVERLAAAFDMHAAVAPDAGGWLVRDGNRQLRVQRTAGLPWFFSTAASSCRLVPEGPPSSDPLQTVPPSGPSECPEDTPPGDVLPRDDAIALGKDTLTRAGLGTSTPVVVDQPGGWYVEAMPQVDGKPVAGLPWTISIGPGRTITAASGYLATAEPADAYRLIDVDTGLVRARPLVDGGTITGVRLGLMLRNVGPAPSLIPAYLFQLEGDPPPIVPVPAVEDRYLS